jgi:GTP-binding protein
LEHNFVDRVKITVRGGSGGNGSVSFRRERCIPNGGPNGGNGGNGGNVFVVATHKMHTLLPFKFKQHFFAENGENGRSYDQTGASGEDVIVEVPLGTVVYNNETGELIADLVKKGQYVCVARGGRGGRGNTVFKSATFQAPEIAEKGFPGEECKLLLEIKLLADVGLIGFPNVGKSTLITKVSNSRAKIGDFPFTTLIPNLGVMKSPSGDGIVIADIPGLIEGAHEGAGLGIYFLRHIERTTVFLHILDVSLRERDDPVHDYHTIWKELLAYNPDLKNKDEIVVLNKIDLSIPEIVDETASYFKKLGKPVFEISAVTGEGIDKLIKDIISRVALFKAAHENSNEDDRFSEGDSYPIPKVEPVWRDLPERIPIEITKVDAHIFSVGGMAFEELSNRLNLRYPDSFKKFMEIIENSRLNMLLIKKGIRNGDTVVLLDQEYEFFDYSLQEEGEYEKSNGSYENE